MDAAADGSAFGSFDILGWNGLPRTSTGSTVPAKIARSRGIRVMRRDTPRRKPVHSRNMAHQWKRPPTGEFLPAY